MIFFPNYSKGLENLTNWQIDNQTGCELNISNKKTAVSYHLNNMASETKAKKKQKRKKITKSQQNITDSGKT